ncbi:MAG: hypothetical protein ABIQ39_16970 [Ilumatobacteraceae bacterium]
MTTTIHAVRVAAAATGARPWAASGHSYQWHMADGMAPNFPLFNASTCTKRIARHLGELPT